MKGNVNINEMVAKISQALNNTNNALKNTQKDVKQLTDTTVTLFDTLQRRIEMVARDVKKLSGTELTQTIQSINKLQKDITNNNVEQNSKILKQEELLKNINGEWQKTAKIVKELNDAGNIQVTTFDSEDVAKSMKVIDDIEGKRKAQEVALAKEAKEKAVAAAKAQKEINAAIKEEAVLRNQILKLETKNTIAQENINNKMSTASVQKKQTYRTINDLLLEQRDLISKMKSAVDNGDIAAAKQYQGELKVINSQIEIQNNKMKNLEGKGVTAWTKLVAKAREYMTYVVSAMIIQQATQSIGKMVNEVVILDKALTELKKVTDLEGESLRQFTKDAFEAAGTVAKTGTEMVEAATEFAKSGYDTKMSLELGKIALMYGNVADEAVNAGDAANFIIAQMKAFNIEAKDAIHIIDAVNAVSNNFAVSSADIANNLGKASAVIANAGNSMEQYIGMMTAITEITRSADKAANGLKTITLRLQGMNDEGDKDLDVQAKMEELFNKLGISVYDFNGELKNTYDILNTLAPVYENLTNAEKAYVTETIAGKFQAQNAAAALSNWKVAIDATATALDSEGSAIKENEKYLDSIEGKMNAVKTQFQELATNLVNSDLVKAVVDFGGAILKVANSDIVQFSVRVAAMFAIFKGGIALFSQGSKVIKTVQLLFNNMPKSVQSLSTSISVLTQRQKLLKLAQDAENVSLATTKTAMTAAGISIDGINTKKKAQEAINKSLIASQAALNIAMGIASLAIMVGMSVWQKYQQAQQEAVQKTIDDASELDEKANAVDDTIARVTELRKVTDDSTSSYKDAVEAREELIKIQKELKEQYGVERDNIDIVTGSIDEQIKKLKELKKEQAQSYIDDNKSAYNDAIKKTTGNNAFSRNMNLGFGTTGGMAGSGSKKQANINYYLGSTPVNASDEFKKQKQAFEEYYNDYKEIMNKFGTLKEDKRDTDGSIASLTFTTKSVDKSKQALEEWKQYLNDSEKQLINSGAITQDEFNAALSYVDKELANITKKFEKEYNAISAYEKHLLSAKGFEFFEEELKKLGKTEVLTKDNVQELINTYPDLQDAMKANGINVEDLIKDYQNQSLALDGIMNKMSEVKDYPDDFVGPVLPSGDEFTAQIKDMVLANDLGHDSIQKLIDKFPTLKEQLDEAGLTVNDFINYLDGLRARFSDLDSYVQNFGAGAKSTEEAISYLNGVVNDFNKEGMLSAETLETLGKSQITLADGTNASYLSFLTFTEKGIKVNTNALYDNIDALRLKAIADIQESAAQQILQLVTEDTKKSTEDAGVAVEDTATKLDESLVADANKIKSNIKVGASYDYVKNAAAGEGLDTSNWDKHQSDIEKIINQAGSNIQALDSYYNSLGKTTTKSSAAAKNEKEWWEKELDSLKDQFNYNEITLSEYITRLTALKGKLREGSDAWRKVNEELQKQRLAKIEDDYKSKRIPLEQYIQALKDLQKEYKEGSKAWLDLADKIKKAYQDLAAEQKNKYDDSVKAANKLIDDEIKALQDKKEALKDVNDEAERAIELQRLQEALENARNNKNKRVWDGSQWTWQADQNAIDDAQKNLDDFNKEEENRAIDDQIKAWQEYKEKLKDAIDRYSLEEDLKALKDLIGENGINGILAQNLDVIKQIGDGYYNLLAEIEKTSNATPESFSGGTSTTSAATSSAPSTPSGGLSSSEIDKLAKEVLAGKYGNGAARKSALGDNYSAVQNRVNQMLGIKGYADGGVVDYTGLAMVHGSKSKPEFMFNYDQMKKFMSSVSHPETKSNVTNDNKNVTYNFSGDFNLPNVQDSKQFLRDLKAQINITKHS